MVNKQEHKIFQFVSQDFFIIQKETVHIQKMNNCKVVRVSIRCAYINFYLKNYINHDHLSMSNKP